MADLKETGELEYDGDVILLLHRGFNAEAAKLIVAKNKYGPVGTAELLFHKASVTFEQIAEGTNG
jgi:replicative DNA helicase